MILVTQGHEKGIGLEVFLKSFLSLSRSQQKEFKLFCNKSTLDLNLKHLNLTSIPNLNTFFIANDSSSQTIRSISEAISSINKNDILLTLPSSKDQFKINNIDYSGHTEYFRKLYQDSNISMTFFSNNMNVLLLTDHIELSKVDSSISSKSVFNKIVLTLLSLQSIRAIDEVLIAGINPHAGEDGLIGRGDTKISVAIQKLKEAFPKIKFFGPLPGDTLHFHHKSTKQLLVYSYHDQGLTIFKQKNGLTGINTTFGLPFLRVSPDHGTAFDLYGKNLANYQGMNYLLNEILNWK